MQQKMHSIKFILKRWGSLGILVSLCSASLMAECFDVHKDPCTGYTVSDGTGTIIVKGACASEAPLPDPVAPPREDANACEVQRARKGDPKALGAPASIFLCAVLYKYNCVWVPVGPPLQFGSACRLSHGTQLGIQSFQTFRRIKIGIAQDYVSQCGEDSLEPVKPGAPCSI